MSENKKPEQNQDLSKAPAPLNQTQMGADGVPFDASPEEREAALAANEVETMSELAIAQAEVATLKAKVADLQDQYVRGQAEVQNARRRADEDVSKARKFAVEAFAESLLPVTDSLEAGLAIKDATIEQVREVESLKAQQPHCAS
jgi:molecular chaperone GrpE